MTGVVAKLQAPGESPCRRHGTEQRWLLPHWPMVALSVALGSGLMLRLIGLDFPVAYGPDQEVIVPLGIRVAAGDLNPHYTVYPGLAIYGPAVMAKIVSLFAPLPDPATLQLPLRMELSNFGDAAAVLRPYYLAARGYTVLLAVATIALAYRAGSDGFGRPVGALASLLTALCAGHAVESHFATADVPAPFWITASAWAALAAFRRSSPRWLCLASALAGLALATKLNTAPVVLLPLAAATRIAMVSGALRRLPGPATVQLLRLGGGVVAATGLVVFLTAPELAEQIRRLTLSGTLPPGFGPSIGNAGLAAVGAGILLLVWSLAVVRVRLGRLRMLLALPLAPSWLLAMIVVVVTFAAASPFTFLDPRQTVGDLYVEFTHTSTGPNRGEVRPGHYGFDLEPNGLVYAPFFYTFGAMLPFSLGLPVAAAAMGGLALGLARRESADRAWLPFLLAYLLSVSLAPTGFARYILPAVPLLHVFTARALVMLVRPRQARTRPLGLFVACAILTYSALYAATSIWRFADDARRDAELFLSRELPVGATVATTQFPNYYPSLDPAHLHPVPCPDGTFDPEVLAGCGADYLLTTSMLLNRPLRDPMLYASRYHSVQALQGGELGYVRIARFSRGYLNQQLYQSLDPMFEGYFVSPTIEIYRRVGS